MRQENVLGIIRNCIDEGKDVRENASKQIIGSTVMTDYNQRTYKGKFECLIEIS